MNKMAKMMSEEAGKAFEKTIKTVIDAFIVKRDTGRTEQLVSAQDQLDAFNKEFPEVNARVDFDD